MRTWINTNKLLILMCLLVSCNTVTDADILAGTKTCRPPCWLDIQPGTTRIDEAIEVLKENENKGEGKLTILDSGIVRWSEANDKNSYLYEEDNGLVTKIELDLRPSSTHLDDILSLFGKPSSLTINKVRDGYFFVTFFYPEKGLAFVGSGDAINTSSGTRSGYKISPDMIIVKGIFLEPSDISIMVDLLYGENAVTDVLADIQVWTGYGDYHK